MAFPDATLLPMRHAVLVSADRSLLEREGSTIQRIAWLWEGATEQLSIVVVTRGACPRGGSEAQIPSSSLAVHHFGVCARTPLGVWLGMRRLRTALSHTQPLPQLVVAQDPLWRGMVGKAVARETGAALAVEAHTDYASPWFPWNGWLRRKLRQQATRHFQESRAVRAVSQRVARGLVQSFGVDERRIVQLPVWIDVEGILQRVPQMPSLHSRFPQFNFIVVWVGRMTEEKGGEVALAAFQRLFQQDPKAGLVMVGDGPLRKQWQRYAQHLGIAEAVVFAGWQEDPLEWIAGADAFLLTSSYEGFGRVLVEAALSKRPIVATDVGIVGEVLRPEEEEVLVASVGDAEGLARHLITLLSDHRARRLLGINARERVLGALGQMMERDQYKERFLSYLGRAVAG